MPLNLSIPFEKKFTFSFVYRPLQSFVSQLKAHERIDCLNSHIREEQKKENTSCHFIPLRRPVQTHSIEKKYEEFFFSFICISHSMTFSMVFPPSFNNQNDNNNEKQVNCSIFVPCLPCDRHGVSLANPQKCYNFKWMQHE